MMGVFMCILWCVLVSLTNVKSSESVLKWCQKLDNEWNSFGFFKEVRCWHHGSLKGKLCPFTFIYWRRRRRVKGMMVFFYISSVDTFNDLSVEKRKHCCACFVGIIQLPQVCTLRNKKGICIRSTSSSIVKPEMINVNIGHVIYAIITV